MLRHPSAVRILCLALMASTVVAAREPVAANGAARARKAPGAGSFAIVENRGQFHPGVRFQMRTGGTTLWLTDTTLWLTRFAPSRDHVLQRDVDGRHTPSPTLGRPGVNLEVTFPGAQLGVVPTASDPLPTKMNYFWGSDPAGWRSGVRTYGAATWANLYPGVSVSFAGANGELALVVDASPSADPTTLRLRVAGADTLRATPDARVVAETAMGDVLLPAIVHEGRPLQPVVRGGDVWFRQPAAGSPMGRPVTPRPDALEGSLRTGPSWGPSRTTSEWIW